MKKLFYTALGLMGLMGTLAIGVVNAETQISEPYGNVEYTLNGDEPFTAKVITITGDDGTVITILDRNLGATATGGEEAYGYHFQWGNNYGFNPTDETIPRNAKSVSSDGAVWDDSGSYNNSGYYGSTFIKGDSSHGYDYWKDSTSSSSNHENLRGGGGDYNDASNGFGKNNENRRGPCPDGFHVPSIGELSKLVSMMTGSNNSEKVTQLHNNLYIPFAGFRNAPNAYVRYMGSYAFLWSSSPYSVADPYSRDLTLGVDGNLGRDNFGRADGLSVRCFYDEYDVYTQPVYFTVTFDTNYGDGNISSQSIKSGSYATQPQDPTLNNATFEGWYLDRELSNKFTFSTAITGNITLYAKYLCDEGYYPLNNGEECFTFDTIYIDDPENPGEGITIMDRNLGAQGVGLGENSYGYYYQRGNNYGFDWMSYFADKIIIYGTRTKPEYKDVYNNHGYYGTKMVLTDQGIKDYWNDNIKHNGIWGGENDAQENNRGYDLLNYEDRQGPCMEGYHIPSIGERGMLIKLYRDNFATGITLNGNQPIFTVSDLNFLNGFIEYFKLEYTARVYGDALLYDRWVDSEMAWYWSSSPFFESDSASYFSIHNVGNVGINYGTGDGLRGNAYVIRCFKNPQIFTVTFDTKWNIEIDPQSIKSGSKASKPDELIRDGYTFDYWYIEGNEDNAFDFDSTITGDITLYAHWTKIESKSSGYSGGGGRGGNKTDINTEGETSADTENVIQSETKGSEESNNTPIDSSAEASEGQVYIHEFTDAYNFAYKNGITTMDTIQKADMEGGLTRIAMAKMLSQYAINVLGMKPDESRVNKFNDVTDQLNEEYNNGIALAYQLGIMGINMPNNEFRPFDLVPRSEFVTALSRMAYGTSDGKYESTPNYYIPHMTILKEKGIVTNNDPYIQELRGYVMIMLMRTNILK